MTEGLFQILQAFKAQINWLAYFDLIYYEQSPSKCSQNHRVRIINSLLTVVQIYPLTRLRITKPYLTLPNLQRCGWDWEFKVG